MKKEPSLKLKEVIKTSEVNFAKVLCPSCGQSGTAADININDKIAKCSSCNVIYSIQPSIQHLLQASAPTSRQELLRPEGIDLYYFKNELDISLPQPVAMLDALLMPFLLIFAVIFTMVFFKKGTISWWIPTLTWILTAIPAFHLIFWKRYKIYITVDKNHLSIIRNPRRFGKDQHFSVEEINQLFVRTKDGMFDLMMVVDTPEGARQIPLIKRFHNLTKARFLEQEIEKYLGIENREILEEVK